MFEPDAFGATIFKNRYSLNETESWLESMSRVSRVVAAAEENGKIKTYADEFYEMLIHGLFMPGGRIVYGSGRPKAQLLNCNVIPTADSREGWGQTASDVIIISGTGGGVGINFSPVRPRGSVIHGHASPATGSVSLMEIVNQIAEVIRAGGGRRAALMMGLNHDHPDIPEFINKKLDLEQLNNANVSIVFMNESPESFLRKVERDELHELTWKGQVVSTIPARQLWDKILDNAVDRGEPGILNGFLANQTNNLAYWKPLVSTNPSMPAGTLVGTQNGIFPIEQLEGKQFNVKSLDGSWTEAHCSLSSENAEILEISFGNHRVTHSTKEHRWPVLGRFGRIHKVYTHELQSGDLIPLNRNEPLGVEARPELTRDEGFLLGYLLGDGWVSPRGDESGYSCGLTFSPTERQMAERLLTILNQLKTHPSTITEREDELQIQWTDANFVARLFNHYGYQPKSAGLPTCIWQSNDRFINGFIDGLLSADGYVSNEENSSPPCIILSSSKKEIAIQFAKLLSFYGISTTINEQITKNVCFPNGKTYSRFYERWDVKMGRSAIEQFANVFTISHTKKSIKLGHILRSSFRTSQKQHFARVVSVKPIGQAKVWDIAVKHNQHVFPSQWCYTGNCGEIWLEPYGCCDLGSLVLPRFITKSGALNKKLLAQTINTAVRFLDDVLEVNYYPLKAIEENAKITRRVGLGVMGLHDMLIRMSMKYSSDQALEFVDSLFSFIKKKAYEASIFLAAEKGQFPALDRGKFVESGFCKSCLSEGMRERVMQHGIRNCALITIAPTGTTSIVQGVSSGIEPILANAYYRNYLKGDELVKEVVEHPLFTELKGTESVKLFENARDIPVEKHLQMQKVCQAHVDNSISKTINLPKDYTSKSLDPILRKYLPYLKGVTLYRDGSRGESPIQPIDIEEAIKVECPSGACEL